MARCRSPCLRTTSASCNSASSTKPLSGNSRLQPLAHGRGQIELVHLVVDVPELHVGFFEQLAAELAGVVGDFFANLEGLVVLVVGVLLQAEFLVAVADVREGVGRLELRLNPQFLVGDLSLA